MKAMRKVAWRIALGTAGSAIAAYSARRAVARRANQIIEAEYFVTIRKPAYELRAMWNDFERLPVWMDDVEVAFDEGTRGTVVRGLIRYSAPMGRLSAVRSGLSGLDPGAQLKEHLRRFKQLAETGEIATNESPSARDKPKAEPGSHLKPMLDAAAAVKNVKKTNAKKRAAKKPAERNVP
ncbi:MAG: hypothetical protein ACAI38_21820 [Myxococcota bacterium]